MTPAHQTYSVELIEEITTDIDSTALLEAIALLEARREALIVENRELKARSPEAMREREMRLIEREEALAQYQRANSPAALSQRAIFEQVSGGKYVH